MLNMIFSINHVIVRNNMIPPASDGIPIKLKIYSKTFI